MRADQRWRHRWQVVRLFDNGALIVMSSHRSELFALIKAHLSNVLDPRTDRVHDVRRTP